MDSDILYYKDLVIRIFVIGYSSQGESIVVLFHHKDKPLSVYFSMVIDSFAVGSGKNYVNKTIEILRSYHVGKINLLCWTHPDKDHTRGLDDILEEFCDEHTSINIPYGIEGLEGDHIAYNIGDVHRIQYMLKLGKTKATLNPITVIQQGHNSICEFDIADDSGSIPVVIEALSPFGAELMKRKDEYQHTNKKIYKNDFSIALTMKVGCYVFNFCGDIVDDAISNIRKSPFSDCIFIKIPHHSSSSTQELVKFLPTREESEEHNIPNITLACTTVFTGKDLPDFDVVGDYLEKNHVVHCTGSAKADNVNYGVVRYIFDLFGKREVRICNYGHALELKEGMDSLPERRTDDSHDMIPAMVYLCYSKDSLPDVHQNSIYYHLSKEGVATKLSDYDAQPNMPICVLLDSTIEHTREEYIEPADVFVNEAQQISFMKLYVELLDSDLVPDYVTLINDNGSSCNVENAVFDEKFKWN